MRKVSEKKKKLKIQQKNVFYNQYYHIEFSLVLTGL